MTKPTPQNTPTITLRNGAAVISDLESKHRAAEKDFAGATAAMQEAATKYDAALGEGRDAALAARRVRNDAEVDLDIARRSVDTLASQVANAHEALRLAGIEHKRAEAERLCRVFVETARRGLEVMSVESRAIARAWAEAELAVQDARQAQGAGAPPIPSAEDFRHISRGRSKEEVRRTRITRWLRPGWGDRPLPDELDRRVVRDGSSAYLPAASRGDNPMVLTTRGVFDRITYVRPRSSTHVPLLIESLCVPSLVEGQAPGWSPPKDEHPRTVLAHLADLERAPAPREPELETVDVFLHLVGAEPEQVQA